MTATRSKISRKLRTFIFESMMQDPKEDLVDTIIDTMDDDDVAKWRSIMREIMADA